MSHPVYFPDGVFVVPVSGYYRITCKVHRGYPTGVFETVWNDDRRWWQFWKPTWVQREIWHWVDDDSGVEVKLLWAGDEVKGPAIRL